MDAEDVPDREGDRIRVRGAAGESEGGEAEGLCSGGCGGGVEVTDEAVDGTRHHHRASVDVRGAAHRAGGDLGPPRPQGVALVLHPFRFSASDKARGRRRVIGGREGYSSAEK